MDQTLRFLHTSDWHLGQPYRSLPPELADRLRSGRLEAVGRMLAAAESLGIDLALVAGDQFDGPNPDPALVGRMLDRIAAHPTIEVHMIPGNHDPGEPGSIYHRAAFDPPPNLRVHLRAAPVPLEGRSATLYPCPCHHRSGDDPMAWIGQPSAGDGWRIGLAHGSIPECLDADGRNYPIRGDAPEHFGLDYLALGDWHTARPSPDERPSARMYYAGTPEVGGWDETGAGSALLVTLEPGRAPEVRRLATGGTRWIAMDESLHDRSDLDRLDRHLGRIAGSDVLVRLRLRGSLNAEASEDLDQLLDRVGDGFAWISMKDEDLRRGGDESDRATSDSMILEVLSRLRDRGRSDAEVDPAAVASAERAAALLLGLLPDRRPERPEN